MKDWESQFRADREAAYGGPKAGGQSYDGTPLEVAERSGMHVLERSRDGSALRCMLPDGRHYHMMVDPYNAGKTWGAVVPQT